jgi:hypothetical protein
VWLCERGYVSAQQRTLTLNALFVSLGAAHHLSRAEIATVNDELKKTLASKVTD